MLQNSTRGFPIFADDAGALGTGLAGLTITAKLRKNGGAEDDVEPTITDLGDGVYWVVPDVEDRDTLGFNVWKFTAAGAVIAPAFEEVMAVDPQLARFGASSQASVDAVAAIAADTSTAVDNLQTDVDGVLGYLATLISRVTAGAAQAWTDLVTMITGSGTADAQFTTKALELAGGGLTEDEQEQLNRIEQGIATVTPTIVTLQAVAGIAPGVIVGPSEPLVIGDDYSATVGRQVRINLVDSNGDPAETTFGTKSLADEDVSIQLLLHRSGKPTTIAQLFGTCTFSPAVAEVPPYLLVSFPRTETAKATPGAYDLQAESRWPDGSNVTFAPYGQIEFTRDIQRTS
jgi:hypothetical protein